MTFINKFSAVAALVLLTSIWISPASADSIIPPRVQAKQALKIIEYIKKGNDSENMVIYVIDEKEVAEAFQTYVGKKFGLYTLKEVVSLSEVPESISTVDVPVLYLNKQKHLDETTALSMSKKAVTATGNTKLINKGISFGIDVEGGKPKIILNLSASAREGTEWSDTILLMLL